MPTLCSLQNIAPDAVPTQSPLSISSSCILRHLNTLVHAILPGSATLANALGSLTSYAVSKVQGSVRSTNFDPHACSLEALLVYCMYSHSQGVASLGKEIIKRRYSCSNAVANKHLRQMNNVALLSFSVPCTHTQLVIKVRSHRV